MNICVIGCGGIGQRHLKAFTSIEGVTCSACEPRKEMAARLKDDFALKDVFHGVDEIDFSALDGVMISTPAHVHVSLAQRCVDAGCPVIIEKPLSISMDGVNELRASARRRNVIVGMGYTRRFLPHIVRVKELVDAGAIGKVLLMEISEGHNYAQDRPDFKTNYFGRKDMGGGVILDVLSHHVNFFEWLVGAPKEVSCLYASLGDTGLETEDSMVFNARFRDNVLASVFFTSIQRDQSLRIRLVGTKRSLHLNINYLKTGLERVVQPQIQLIAGGNEIENITLEPMGRDTPYLNQAKNFIDAVRGKQSIRTTLDEGISSLVTVLTARKACDTKRILPIPAPAEQP